MVVLGVTACHRSSGRESEISVRKQVTPQPVRVGPATITIQIADASQKPLSRATILVEADMAHPGMGPVLANAEETAPGSYLARIGFNMGGDWVLLLHIKLPDGRKFERQMDVRGVRSN
jgi:YtkA-like